MRQIILRLTVAAAVCAAAAPPSNACDRAAAGPLDRSRPAGIPGVTVDMIDGKVAVPACEGALAAVPENPHYTPASARNGSDFWAYSVRNDSAKLDSADLRYLLQVLRKQLYGCWNRPAGVSGADADAPSATVRFKLKQDGSLAGEPMVVGSHADPSQAVAKTALAAVKRCQPLRLPPNLYEFWKEVEINFVANAPI